MLANLCRQMAKGMCNVTLKADSHELRLTCTGMAEGCMQKIENFLSQLQQRNRLLQMHMSNAVRVNEPSDLITKQIRCFG